jgi:pteridine reductase
MKLHGKIALVTGAARRVGRAIAETLASDGATVVIHHHASPDEAAAVARACGDALVLRADLRVPAECVRLVDETVRAHGRVDLLVNSAASYPRAPFAEQDDALWDDTLALNLVAPARLVRLALPHGLSSVVNIIDVAAWQPWRNHAAYSAAKAGLAHLTRCLALELAPSVRVNAVAPGTVAFPPDMKDSERDAILRRIPLARAGDPSDVARAVSYLAAEPYLTGLLLPVDGGSSLR